jgi:histidinol-phosphate aminotransferase
VSVRAIPADSALAAVRPEIRALATYAAPAASGPAPILKLDFNESPFDVPEEIKGVVLARLAERRWSLYPERRNPRLVEALAARLGVSPSELAVGNGSGELILAAVSVFAGQGGTLVLAPPTFSLYRQMAAISGARLSLVPRLGPDLAVDEEEVLARVAGTGAIPLVCSPNNPTGGVVSRELVRRLAAAASVVLLDQAYVDFAAEEDDALPLLPELPNLVVFRTLSKAYAAAGFRIGYVAARAGLLAEIEKAYLPYSVDHAAEELALALLERPEISRRLCALLASERERVAARLRQLSLAVPPSRSNFLFFAPRDGDGRALHARLLARGIAVRELHATHPGHLRVTVGSPEQNDLFLAVLAEEL